MISCDWSSDVCSSDLWPYCVLVLRRPLRGFTRVPSGAKFVGVSVLCLESLVRRTLLLKFGHRLHLHKGVPYIPRQEFILREGRPTRVHVLRDKRALEGPPRFSHHHNKLGHSEGRSERRAVDSNFKLVHYPRSRPGTRGTAGVARDGTRVEDFKSTLVTKYVNTGRTPFTKYKFLSRDIWGRLCANKDDGRIS